MQHDGEIDSQRLERDKEYIVHCGELSGRLKEYIVHCGELSGCLKEYIVQ